MFTQTYPNGAKVKVRKEHENHCAEYSCKTTADHLIITSFDPDDGCYYYNIMDKDGDQIGDCSCFSDQHLINGGRGRPRKVVAPKPPLFILQYEVDGDPIEKFQTLKEVKARIAELKEDGGHSFEVFKIEKAYTVTLSTLVELKE